MAGEISPLAMAEGDPADRPRVDRCQSAGPEPELKGERLELAAVRGPRHLVGACGWGGPGRATDRNHRV